MKKYESPTIEQAGGNGEMGVPFHENHVAHQFNLAVTAEAVAIFVLVPVVAVAVLAVATSPSPDTSK